MFSIPKLEEQPVQSSDADMGLVQFIQETGLTAARILEARKLLAHMEYLLYELSWWSNNYQWRGSGSKNGSITTGNRLYADVHSLL